MAYVWSITIFLSAFLLFLVQPMMGKMILPMLGGTPSVWNTCMLFYQATLLAGYGYVHLLNLYVPPLRQIFVHVALVAVPLLFLPIGLPAGWVPPDEANPVGWVLLLLAVAIGLPFLVISTSAPLLQKWFSWTDHPSAKDPYFLYAASNAGSMLALLGYPFLIEPRFSLQGAHGLTQVRLWSAGYVILVALIALCAWLVKDARPAVRSAEGPASPLSASMMLRWTLLAFIPSSLLLGATTHLTLNVASIPLLWVIPLALYLLSFILVFARWPPAVHRAMVILLPLVLLLLVFDTVASPSLVAIAVRIGVPLLGLTVVALVCHGELARLRPPTDRLTVFYLVMSAGGALGGLFNALLAPVLFNDIYEYEIALLLSALVIPSLADTDSLRTARWSPYRSGPATGRASAAAWTVALVMIAGLAFWSVLRRDDPMPLRYLWSVAPLVVCYLAVGRAPLFALALGVTLLTTTLAGNIVHDPVLYQTRTFFGVLKVEHNKSVNTHALVHGTINHGKQRVEPEHQRDSITYFHPAAPYGQVFAAFSGPNAKTTIAVTGLGIAALANYVDAGQSLTYYEIDPAVVSIAQMPQFFTYYGDATARGVDLNVLVGDARLKMEAAKDDWYDMIILDAFTSDAIPVHLLTREAMEMYLRKLTQDGLLVVHISNNYLALEPVLGNLAEALHLVALKQFSVSDGIPFKSGSDLVVMARTREALGPLAKDPRWEPVARSSRVGLWSDDFSNLVSVIDW